MAPITTETGSLAILVRATDPLFSTLARIKPLDEPAPIYRSVVADLGIPGQFTGPAPVIAGTVLG